VNYFVFPVPVRVLLLPQVRVRVVRKSRKGYEQGKSGGSVSSLTAPTGAEQYNLGDWLA